VADFNSQTDMFSQRPAEQMTAEPVSMRGGEAAEICCGL
jgi:hypothetical protein